MKILDSSLSLSTLVNDTTNGLGQIQPLECTVTEELNGIYECEFSVLVTDPHYEDLRDSGLIKVTHNDTDDEQIFRCYYFSEPINEVVTVKAQHISYDLSKVTVKPFTATGASVTCSSMVSNILGSYPFTMTTDISNTTSVFTLDIPRSFRECLGGYEGSILDVFRGEYEWDNLTVKMLAERGDDNGVRIAYGKNLVDFTQEENNENVYDGVYGYAVVDDVTYEASSYYNKTGATYPKIKNVDFSENYESGDVPTAAELLAYATTYATNNDIEVPNVNITIDFVPLWQTEEYKDILPLERVKLGDTVHVYFEKLNVETSARVIKTVWNPLTEKYDEIELGNAKANLNTVLSDAIEETEESQTGYIDQQLMYVTKLVANGMGLHVTRDTSGVIYLHNEETLSSSQYQYMISSGGFLLSDDYGQTWSSGWTTSGDAVMNSLATITLNALEIYGSYIQGSEICFGDPTDSNQKTILAQPYDYDSDGYIDSVLFDGDGYIVFRPQEAFIVENNDSSGNYLNAICAEQYTGTHTSGSTTTTYTGAHIVLRNYDYTVNETGNSLSLVNMIDDYGRMNSFILNNYAYYNSSNMLANYISMSGSPQPNSAFYLRNNNLSTGNEGNVIYMGAGASATTIQLANYNYSGSTISSDIYMSSTSSYNLFRLSNYDSSGNSVNYLLMRNDNGTTLYSGGELRLSASGAIRLSSSNSQDIVISAADDLYLSFSDKLYIKGTQYTPTSITVSGTTYVVIARA